MWVLVEVEVEARLLLELLDDTDDKEVVLLNVVAVLKETELAKILLTEL